MDDDAGRGRIGGCFNGLRERNTRDRGRDIFLMAVLWKRQREGEKEEAFLF